MQLLYTLLVHFKLNKYKTDVFECVLVCARIIKCCWCCFCECEKSFLSATLFFEYACVCARYLLSSRSHICYSSMLFMSLVFRPAQLNVNDEEDENKRNVSIYNTLNVNGHYILYCSRCFLQIMHLLNSLFDILCRIGAIFAVVDLCCCCFRLLSLLIWPFGISLFLFVMRSVGCFVCVCDSSEAFHMQLKWNGKKPSDQNENERIDTTIMHAIKIEGNPNAHTTTKKTKKKCPVNLYRRGCVFLFSA